MSDNAQCAVLALLGGLLFCAVIRRLYGGADVPMFAGLVGGTFFWLKLKAAADELL
jgi:hypothetical protein